MLKQVVRIWWIAAVIFGVFSTTFLVSQKEIVDQTVIADPDNAYKVSSDATLYSKMWFAIKSEGELIPCKQSEGSYQVQISANQRWSVANDNMWVNITAPTVGYVQAVEYAQTAEIVLTFAIIAMLGLLILLAGLIITT